ncbi:hypothetical protein N866_07205 [Actinotalea ferrariae CF5-4]|uniref:Minor tail protein n=1 Tax=Actinotalea ferrariae CF5-4 TaxID=948458 RepID=A0A021VU09_9CELL|nr:hypothetical protein [Actinotalea ferrariae]EYR64679.1 hypothetical protein N866_07205 [Actinotalea ferrariae CF5-4]
MSAIVYAVPGRPPAPPANPWPGMRMTWTGWDGSEWDLTDPEASGVSLQAGVRGLLMPPFRRHTTSSPAVAGSRPRGYSTDERPVFWPVKVFQDTSSQDWIDHDAAFWRTLAPGRTGVWTVTQPSGRSRSLRCRFEELQDGLDIDPSLMGWVVYGITLVAEEPFWTGEPVTRQFVPSTTVPFFPGPPFGISEGSLSTSAAIDNPGDEPAYLSWWLHGPTTGTFGVGGRVIDVPFEVAPGRTLVLDSAPTVRGAREIDTPPAGLSPQQETTWVSERLRTAAVDRTKDLGATSKWGAVPAGTAVPLSVAAVGTGALRASLLPQHYRAW